MLALAIHTKKNEVFLKGKYICKLRTVIYGHKKRASLGKWGKLGFVKLFLLMLHKRMPIVFLL